MEAKSPPQSPTRATLLRRLMDLDTSVSLQLYTFFHPIAPHFILKALEFSGDGRLFFPIILSLLVTETPFTAPISITSPISIAASISIIATNLILINLLLGSLLDLLLVGLLKHLIQRPRPVYNKNMFISFAVDHWSFPSGHSSRVSFIATFCYLYGNQIREVLLMKFLRFDAESVIAEYFVAVVGMWAAITTFSRVLLGRHFLLDVLAGACLGVVEGLLVFRVLNYENLVSWFR